VFSFLRQLTTWHCPHVLVRAALLLTAGRAAIDRYLVAAEPASAKLTKRRAAAGRTDRHTDGRSTVT